MTTDVTRCPLCLQRAVRGTVCRACGYSPRPPHPLHPDEQVPDAPESDADPTDATQRPPEGHGPYDDDWLDLGSGG